MFLPSKQKSIVQLGRHLYFFLSCGVGVGVVVVKNEGEGERVDSSKAELVGLG